MQPEKHVQCSTLQVHMLHNKHPQCNMPEPAYKGALDLWQQCKSVLRGMGPSMHILDIAPLHRPLCLT